jgi:Proteasome activator PA28, C-terminal
MSGPAKKRSRAGGAAAASGATAGDAGTADSGAAKRERGGSSKGEDKDLIPEIRERLQKRAHEVLKVRLPAMVRALDARLAGDGVFSTGASQANVRGESLRSLSVLDTDHASSASASDTSAPAPAKKRKREDAAEGDADAPAEEGESVVVTTHSILVEMTALLAGDIAEMMELLMSIKVWIQLLLPRIEDGNNFGVGIQEEVITELQRAEDAGVAVLGEITKYHATRAKLVSKFAKYPGILDYHRSVVELDQKAYVTLRLALIDQRNFGATMVDMVQKNLDKIERPRESQSMGMY